MSDGRKTPLGPWVAVLIGLPVLYVVSFGPACWTTSRTNSGAGIIPVVYAPIVKCLSSKKMWLRWTVSKFSTLGAPPEWTWRPDDEIPIRNKIVMPEHWKWCNRVLNAPIEKRRFTAHSERMRNNK